MLEALWAIKFSSSIGDLGSGVVVLETGKLYGGDSDFYYIGSYNRNDDNTVEASVNVRNYSGLGISIINSSNFHVKLTGTIEEELISLEGSPDVKPEVRINVSLKKIVDLP